MRFSVWPSPAQSWNDVFTVCRHAEATGWDGAWFADHFMPDAALASDASVGPMLECWSVLSALASSVPRIRLGALVAGNTYRHPAIVANIAATIDQISGGRVVLGLGAGWQVNEHEAYGIELPAVGPLLDRFEEACAIVKSLLSQTRTTFHGRYYDITDAPCEPKPVQQPLPLLIGGGGEKRTMRVAARYADEWNCWGTPDVMAHKVTVLRQHCEDVGRDPAAISVSSQALIFMGDDEGWLEKMRSRQAGRANLIGTPAQLQEEIAAYAAAGVGELIVPDFTFGPTDRKLAALDRFLAEVAAPFR